MGLLDITYSDVRFDGAGNVIGNARLQSRDIITVREVPDWNREDRIEIRGEVVFPGIYVISPGETISQVIERAGGLTDLPSLRVLSLTELQWQLARLSGLALLHKIFDKRLLHDC